MKRFMFAAVAALVTTPALMAENAQQCPEGMLLTETGMCGVEVILPAPRGEDITRKGVAVLAEVVTTEDGFTFPVYTVVYTVVVN